MNRVLSFSNYQKIFEADENVSSKAAAQIVDLFFQAYGTIVTKIGDYKEAIDDLLAVAEEKDTTKKGQIMANMIDKVVKKVDPAYKEAGDALLQVAKKIQEAYTNLISTEEGKASLEEINKAIYRQILAKQQGLTTAAKEIKVDDTNKDKANESIAYGYLYEKNTFDDERNSLITKIKPLYADVVQQIKSATSEGIKSKSVEIAKKLKSMYALLSDTAKFEGMKRKERLSTLEKSNEEYEKLVAELNDARKKELLKIGVDKKITASLDEIIKLINTATEKITAVDNKKAEDQVKVEDEKKEEDKTDDKAEKEYSEIKSGTVEKGNLSSKGKFVDQIKSFQEAFNNLFPGEKIKADGLYGKNTEKAVLKVANLVGGLIGEDLAKGTDSGKKLTPELQSAADSYIENKDKIKELISVSSGTKSEDEGEGDEEK
jgi:hypothetical protein